MMRVVIVALACVLASPASAGTLPWSVDVPASFREQAGASEPHITYASRMSQTVGVDSKIYTAGDVQLTRIMWRLKLAAPTRGALDQLDRHIVANDGATVTKQVSAVRLFKDEQMIVDAFDEIDKKRVYHRRLYAADRSGVVHVLWVICTGPANQIAACEQAQQTMRLALADPAPLPDGGYNDAPAQARLAWSFVLPTGYAEVPNVVDDVLTKLRGTHGMLYTDARMYKSPTHDVRLFAVTSTLLQMRIPTRREIEGMAGEFMAGTAKVMTKHISDSHGFVDDVFVMDEIDEVNGMRFHQRHLIGVGRPTALWIFGVVCAGDADKLGECEAAQQSMLLNVPNAVTPAVDPKPTVKKSRSLLSLIGSSAMAALVVGLAIWIAQSAQRGRRKRRR
jgi:hypothetical protein